MCESGMLQANLELISIMVLNTIKGHLSFLLNFKVSERSDFYFLLIPSHQMELVKKLNPQMNMKKILWFPFSRCNPYSYQSFAECIFAWGLIDHPSFGHRFGCVKREKIVNMVRLLKVKDYVASLLGLLYKNNGAVLCVAINFLLTDSKCMFALVVVSRKGMTMPNKGS